MSNHKADPFSTVLPQEQAKCGPEPTVKSLQEFFAEHGKNIPMPAPTTFFPPWPQKDGHTPKTNAADKDTNPKDIIASNKLPLSIVPSTLDIYASLAFLEGALKYGRFNWRIAGVRSSIYIDALKRHIASFENGEDNDPKTGVPHLANAVACLAILIDAKVCNKLNDDRAPRAPIADMIRTLEAEVVRLKVLFKDHHPHQYTIADGQEGL